MTETLEMAVNRKLSNPVRMCVKTRFLYTDCAVHLPRIVCKNWDTQRIGTRLKIVKIIILADPKNWTILRKRKNIRNFSDPKNWDGVLGAPKLSKTCLTLLVYKRCPHVLWYSVVNKGQKRHRYYGFQCSSASRNILK